MESISEIITKELRKLLKLVLLVVLFILGLYTTLTVRSIKYQASQLAIQHLTSVASNLTILQNYHDVDKEVRRFVEAWEKTQDFDLRVLVYLNGTLISQAGEMRPFKWLASNDVQNINLPSGDTLQVDMGIDLRQFLLIAVLQLFVYWGFAILLFRTFQKRMAQSVTKITNPLTDTIAWLKNISEKLPGSLHNFEQKEIPPILEIQDLWSTVNQLLSQIKNLETDLADIHFDKGRIKMAEQLAHNIKGAISTLQIRISTNSSLSEKQRVDLLKSVDDIRQTSTRLLSTRNTAHGNRATSDIGPVLLGPLIAEVLEQKRFQYKLRHIEFLDHDPTKNIDVYAEAIDLKNILSNLIDNAVDAKATRISINADTTDKAVEIKISDNGSGIPPEVMSKIGQEGFSFGKKQGNGLGVSHALETLKSWGGLLEIDSTINKGTAVILSLKGHVQTNDEGFDLALVPDSELIIVDDEAVIHDAWDIVLEPILASNPEIKVAHIYSPKKFDEWIVKNGAGSFGKRLYLFDYNFKGEKRHGINLIDDYGLALESILITGDAQEPTVIGETRSRGIKLVSKELMSKLKIFVKPRQTLIHEVSESMALAVGTIGGKNG